MFVWNNKVTEISPCHQYSLPVLLPSLSYPEYPERHLIRPSAVIGRPGSTWQHQPITAMGRWASLPVSSTPCSTRSCDDDVTTWTSLHVTSRSCCLPVARDLLTVGHHIGVNSADPCDLWPVTCDLSAPDTVTCVSEKQVAQGCQIWVQRGSDLPQMGQIRNFFRSISGHFGVVPEFSRFEPIGPTLGPMCTSLVASAWCVDDWIS